MTALRWIRTHWLPVLVGAFLAAIAFEFLTRGTSLEPAAAVGFMLAAILGGSLLVLTLGNAVRIDDVDERVAALEQQLAPDEVGGWPAEEPNLVEPPITEPIPVQPRTEPMALGDAIEADLRAHVVREAEQRPTPHKRMVEKTFGDVTLRIMEEAP